MNTFNLEFDKTAIMLAGRDYGISEFEKQIKGKVDYNQDITLVFPDNIRSLATSFIQGFFLEFKDKLGLEGIEERVTVVDNGRDFKKLIIDNLI
ncbi:MAG: hypothetical protein Q4D45_10525 [Lachnospiraceae bacterium]|nr:hypothetical protein [Lachnospiraceae bacterium]